MKSVSSARISSTRTRSGSTCRCTTRIRLSKSSRKVPTAVTRSRLRLVAATTRASTRRARFARDENLGIARAGALRGVEQLPHRSSEALLGCARTHMRWAPAGLGGLKGGRAGAASAGCYPLSTPARHRGGRWCKVALSATQLRYSEVLRVPDSQGSGAYC